MALPVFLRRRVLPSSDPHQTRLVLLDDLRRAAGVSGATCYRVVRRPGEQVIRLFGMTAIGTPRFEAAAVTMEGMPIMPYAGNGLKHLTSVTAFEIQRRETFGEELPLIRDVWAPGGAWASCGVSVLDDDGNFIAWIGAFQLDGDERMPERVKRSVSERYAPFRDLLIAAHRAEDPGTGGATFVLGAAGHVLLASQRAKEWRARDGFWKAIKRDIESLSDEREVRRTHFRSAAITITRVVEDLGVGHVVTVSPQQDMHFPPLMRLSREQRIVAESASLGLTVSEIAADLGRSPDTIESHLRSVYDALGIASRAELALAVSDVIGQSA